MEKMKTLVNLPTKVLIMIIILAILIIFAILFTTFLKDVVINALEQVFS